ncbi:aminotransferase class V-fold PLP-dependent enzyme [Candidatus Kaiserbacteria bacterium]|nr:aminotransferase class V-fold PLP-dependent enzyme [Candidatus Kaiserbacteria bacterium]
MFWKRRTYLDYAAGASGNPSSPHAEGRAAKGMLEDARREIARLAEVKPDDVIFTSGATEANAIAILGIAKPGDHIFYMPGAHASIVENIKLLATRGTDVEMLPIKGGRVDTESLKQMIRPKTRLIAMEAVCGETGTTWNTREVAHSLQEFFARSGQGSHSQKIPAGRALLHVDASQAPLTEKISRAHFSADVLTFDSAKVGGPRGVGCLIAHRTITWIAQRKRSAGACKGIRRGAPCRGARPRGVSCARSSAARATHCCSYKHFASVYKRGTRRRAAHSQRLARRARH